MKTYNRTLANKGARAYRNTTNFFNMVYFICDKLKFDYPLYLTESLIVLALHTLNYEVFITCTTGIM